jgi:hypothetical protein
MPAKLARTALLPARRHDFVMRRRRMQTAADDGVGALANTGVQTPSVGAA